LRVAGYGCCLWQLSGAPGGRKHPIHKYEAESRFDLTSSARS
jgi:hypothetical protein